MPISGSAYFTPRLSLGGVRLALRDETNAPVPANRAIELLRVESESGGVSIHKSIAYGRTTAAGDVELKFVPQGDYVLSVPGFDPDPARLSIAGDVSTTIFCRIPKSTRPDR